MGKGIAGRALNKPEKPPASAAEPTAGRPQLLYPACTREGRLPRPGRPPARPRRSSQQRSHARWVECEPRRHPGLRTLRCVGPASRRGLWALLGPSMEGATSPSSGGQLELSVLEEQPDEQAPLNGDIQVIPASAKELSGAQAIKQSPWSSCNKTLVGKCKLWMVIASIFISLIIIIIISLCLIGATYIDEDENEILELSSNKTFFVMLKVPEECVTEEELPGLLLKRLTAVYSSSPSLSRYFTSVEIADFSGDNATITYHLQFGVPSEDASFMKYMMSEELVLGLLLQDFHDQSISGCENLGLDPSSFSLFE
ncbi:TPA-induced transmembrane protein [Elephas maximus indicus]|uniref:TPA-induced transmembrane protein n=1 Tax=Elephas maximus indicus TaxID=99487 RepID=UPI002116FAF2|nr:TPA-induced transmembrane protein [Elephas maximus indicus]